VLIVDGESRGGTRSTASSARACAVTAGGSVEIIERRNRAQAAMSNADRYRRNAEYVAREAEAESNHERRKRILHIAQGWLALAESEEWLSGQAAPLREDRPHDHVSSGARSP
jgi:hypothetical protein